MALPTQKLPIVKACTDRKCNKSTQRNKSHVTPQKAGKQNSQVQKIYAMLFTLHIAGLEAFSLHFVTKLCKFSSNNNQTNFNSYF